MSVYKLSAVLKGHDDDVRAVAFPSKDLVLTASRDGSVRTWKLQGEKPPVFDQNVALAGSAFVNSLAFVPPSTEYPEGLVASGGKDTVIDVRKPSSKPEDNAERLLLGHGHNVCALDVGPDGKWIVSGSWDSSARVWHVGKWNCFSVLEGHTGSVWSVLVYDNETVITACADHMIRVFDISGKPLRTISGSGDVVRALCKTPFHPSGAEFASAGNDGVVRLWQLNGRQVAELHGHSSFIYALACTPSGEIVSSGEDRTVRVWKNTECVQTITHPAISVWTVAVCKDSGDIVTGASDRIARVFSRDSEKFADEATLSEFENSIQSSSIPQQQMGDIQKDKLPGAEFLIQKSGTKDGQVVMIRQGDGSVTAHTWSSAAREWVNVGTVVDAVGSSGKKVEYNGQSYDYVFDVDIEDGKPPLKLPYNLSQNPYEAATKFITDNELPMSYLEEVANFITTNTKGATLGQNSSSQGGGDAWGTGSRYIPGQTSESRSIPPAASSANKILPQTTYLSIRAASTATIMRKIEELNATLSSQNDASTLSAGDISNIKSTIAAFDQDKVSSTFETSTLSTTLDILSNIITSWPPPYRLPALDLLRLLVAASPSAAKHQFLTPSGASETIIALFNRTDTITNTEQPNNAMLAVRTLANLFNTPLGISLAEQQFDLIHHLTSTALKGISNKNLIIATTTLYINFSVLLTSQSHRSFPSSGDRALELLAPLFQILAMPNLDAEAEYRALVALGTLCTLSNDILEAADGIYGLKSVLKASSASSKESRIRNVAGEISALPRA